MSRENPYVGLRALERSDDIFGRDYEIRDLLNALLSERIVLLHAPSGIGKTSLIQAGLIPLLEDERGMEVLPPMRVIGAGDAAAGPNRYLYSLYASLESVFGEPDGNPQTTPGAPDSKVKLVRDASPLTEEELLDFDTFEQYLAQRWKPLPDFPDQVLIFDQFEEIVTVDPHDLRAKRDFFYKVGRALRDGNRYALFVTRDEYVAALEQYARWIPHRLQERVRLRALSPSNALRAIVEPAKRQNVHFEPEAAEKLVNDLRRRYGVGPAGEEDEKLEPLIEPVQLQVVCQRLWNELEKERALDDDLITVAEIDATKNVSEALGDFYAETIAEVVAETDISEGFLRRWIADNLIAGNGIRSQVLIEDEESGSKSRIATAVLWGLHEKRLLRVEQRKSARWFELTHDRMVEPIQENNEHWFESRQSTLQLQAGIWARRGKPRDLLLRDAMLGEAEKWADENAGEMGDLERRFLELSRREGLAVQEREIDRKNRELRQQKRIVEEAQAREKAETEARRLAEVQRREAEAREREQQAAATLLRRRMLYVLGALTIAILSTILAVVSLATAWERNRQLDAGTITLKMEVETRTAAEEKAKDQAAIAARAVIAAENAKDRAEGATKRWILAVGEAYEAENEAKRDRTIAEQERIKAEENLALAESNRLAGESQRTNDQNLSLLLARQALAISPGPEALEAARDALERAFDRPYSDSESGIVQILFSDDGRILATVSEQGEEAPNSRIEVWAVGGDSSLTSLGVVEAESEINSLALAADGRFLALVTGTGLTEIWALNLSSDVAGSEEATAEETPILDQIERIEAIEALEIAFLSGGRRLALIDSANRVRRFDIIEGADEKEGELSVEEVEVNGDNILNYDGGTAMIAVSPVNAHLAAVSNEGALAVVSFDGAAATIRGHCSEYGLFTALDAKYVSDGRLVTSSGSGFIVWQMRETEETPCLEQLLQIASGSVDNLSISPDSSLVAASSESEGVLRLWELSFGNLLAELRTETRPLSGTLTFSADGRRLAAADAERGSLFIWDTKTFQLNEVLQADNEGDELAVGQVAFSPDDALLLITAGPGDALRRWRLGDGSQLFLSGHQSDVYALAFNPRASDPLLISGDRLGIFKTWDVVASTTTNDTTPLLTIDDVEGYMGRVSWHPNGEIAAFGGSDGRLRFWTMEAETLEGDFSPGEDAIFATAFSPNGTWLAAGDLGGRFYIWDAEQLRDGDLAPSVDRDLLAVADSGGVYSVAFSRDSRLVAASVADGFGSPGRILLWRMEDLLDGESAREPLLEIDVDFALTVLFHPQLDILLAGDGDGALLGWDVSPAALANGNVEPGLQEEGVHEGVIWDLALDESGRWLTTVGEDGRFILWELGAASSGSAPVAITSTNVITTSGPLRSTAVSAGGKYAVFGASDGTIRVEQLHLGSVEQLVAQLCRSAEHGNLRYIDWVTFIDPAETVPYEKVCANNPIPEHAQAIQGLVNRTLDLAMQADSLEEPQLSTAALFLQRAVDLDRPLGYRTVLAQANGTAMRRDPAVFVTATFGIAMAQRGGDLTVAAEALESALAQNRSVVATIDDTIIEDPDQYVGRLAVPAQIQNGRALASDGDIESALAQFNLALRFPDEVEALDVEVFADPQDVAVQLAVSHLLDSGRGQPTLAEYATIVESSGRAEGVVAPNAGDLWSFEGEEDQLVEILMARDESGLDTYLYLVGPDGRIVARNDDTFGSRDSALQLRLPETGRYLILARGYADSSGEYVLQLNDQYRSVDLVADTMVTGDVQSYENVAWLFEGTSGDIVSFLLEAETTQLYLTVLQPDGDVLSVSNPLAEPCDSFFILPEDGIYTLFVGGSSAEETTFTLQAIASPRIAAACDRYDQSVELAQSGDLDAALALLRDAIALDSDVFSEEVVDDPEAYLTTLAAQSGLLGLQEILFNYNQDPVTRFSRASNLAEAAGDAYAAYLVCFTGLDEAAADLVTDICEFASTLTVSIVSDEPVSGEVIPYGGDAWTFEGSAGNEVTIVMESAPLDTYLTLLGPDNFVLDFNDDFGSTDVSQIGPLTLPADGAYVILAHGYSDSSGPYELTLQIEPQ